MTYQKCEDCRSWINVTHTDHIKVRGEDDAIVYLHMRPCYQRYAEFNKHEVTDRVLLHQHRS